MTKDRCRAGFRPSIFEFWRRMSSLAQIISAIEVFDYSVESQIRKARSDAKAGADLRRRWRKIRKRVPIVETPTGLKLPRLALPQTDEPGEIARFLYGEGLPGEFPFVNAAYPEMYLAKPGDGSHVSGARSHESGARSHESGARSQKARV